MNRQEIVRIVFPRSVRTLPADIKLIFVYLSVMCLAILLPGIRETPIRAGLGLPFVLFVPGYLFIAALFPEETADTGDDTDASQSGIDGIERVALSFGMSIAIVPADWAGLEFHSIWNPAGSNHGLNTIVLCCHRCRCSKSTTGTS